MLPKLVKYFLRDVLADVCFTRQINYISSASKGAATSSSMFAACERNMPTFLPNSSIPCCAHSALLPRQLSDGVPPYFSVSSLYPFHLFGARLLCVAK